MDSKNAHGRIKRGYVFYTTERRRKSQGRIKDKESIQGLFPSFSEHHSFNKNSDMIFRGSSFTNDEGVKKMRDFRPLICLVVACRSSTVLPRRMRLGAQIPDKRQYFVPFVFFRGYVVREQRTEDGRKFRTVFVFARTTDASVKNPRLFLRFRTASSFVLRLLS